MKGTRRSWAIQNHKFVILKMGITIFTTVLVLRLFLNHSFEFHSQSPVLQQTSLVTIRERTDFAPQPLSVDFDGSLETTQFNQEDDSFDTQMNDDDPPSENIIAEFYSNGTVQKDYAGECDPFKGEWIPNPAGPAYINETCDLIESHQNCMTNGRPDFSYLYWRWRPRNCELPLFEAKRFLKMMRNKTWALIGDSISRNHVQSLVCTLSQVEKADPFYHDEDFRSKGWRFPSYNLTIYVLWSPFLVEAAIFEDFDGVSNREIELHLDRQDKKWTEIYKNLDYMIFATGKWFLKAAIYYKNNTIRGCHYCPHRNLTELGFEFAYREALRSTLDFIAKSGHRGVIFFRTSTPDHFEGGEWNEGGHCDRTVPFKEGEIELKDLHKLLRRIELEEFETAEVTASQNGLQLKLLDFMQISLLRPDGHPGPYRDFHPFAKDMNAKVQNDCLHWCLPGPIDAWNDVIMQMVVNG